MVTAASPQARSSSHPEAMEPVTISRARAFGST